MEPSKKYNTIQQSANKTKAGKRSRGTDSESEQNSGSNNRESKRIKHTKYSDNVQVSRATNMFPTPDKENIEPCNEIINCNKENKRPTPVSPFPSLDFASSRDIWESMRKKDVKYLRNGQYMSYHPDLIARMRTVLLDWLIEVCEVYALHRETFYLSVNFVDRYLSVMHDVKKTELQLVGITALFIASKLEEIYPPQLNEFAFVTDGACTEDQILKQELIMLNKLKWSLSPTTPISWLNTYLQTAHQTLIPNIKSTFILPQYPQVTFANVAQLLDLCILDIEHLDFQPSILAASALYHFSSCELATHVSGLSYEDLILCIQWLTPFATAISIDGLQPLKEFNKYIAKSELHNIQSHSNSMDSYDFAYKTKLKERSNRASPVEVGGLITPPNSSEKHYNLNNGELAES